MSSYGSALNSCKESKGIVYYMIMQMIIIIMTPGHVLWVSLYKELHVNVISTFSFARGMSALHYEHTLSCTATWSVSSVTKQM